MAGTRMSVTCTGTCPPLPCWTRLLCVLHALCLPMRVRRLLCNCLTHPRHAPRRRRAEPSQALGQGAACAVTTGVTGPRCMACARAASDGSSVRSTRTRHACGLVVHNPLPAPGAPVSTVVSGPAAASPPVASEERASAFLLRGYVKRESQHSKYRKKTGRSPI